MVQRKEGRGLQPNISLWLDGYGDIFSDFDPRDNSVRALSVDFLEEAKRAAVDKSEGLELNILIPKDKRNQKTEEVIKKRLANHFERHHLLLEKEKKSTIKTGLLFILVGIVIMTIATYVLIYYESLANFMLILLEPAGWFFLWDGLEIALFKSKDKKSELEFYRKLSDAEINFDSY